MVRLLLIILAVGLAFPAAAVPKVQTVTAANGVTAWLIEDHTHPILHVSFGFKGGAALEPEGKEGLAYMVSTLLDEGAGNLDSQAFQRKLEDLSVDLSFSSGRDRFTGTLTTLTRNLKEAEDLLSLALAAPRFDEEPVARMRALLLAGRHRAVENPNSIASRRFMKSLFPNHPYGRSIRGTVQTITDLTIADIKGFVQRHFARDRLVVGLYGDITPERAKAFLDRSFTNLPLSGGKIDLPETEPTLSGQVQVINEDVEQSIIMFGQQGLSRRDPDYYGALVLDYILGGGSLSSRLYEEVRDKRGLAYSVGTDLWPLDRAALYIGEAGTANARAAETIAVVREQWNLMRDTGPTDEEVRDAKTYLTGSYPLRFTSGSALAATLMGMQIHDLGLDYLDRRNGFIESITPEDVRRIAKRLLTPDRLTFVVVGQPEGM
ncbi:pitrilysin family protein [Magnetospira sp. QH-2]|uniref:M16 family metallopeptidase n=1 Tax=Magnetospira sp. (strain QH-2) TaxID=1288970 RepID=UPI0003E81029|nr:pitrilysin family protein [Magnetospira sp. QH-2]CCQ72292.1 Zinc protease (peptidase M16 family) [Magnetospira sp. QH-2]